MGRRRDSRAKIERGDFQTPPALAAEVCRVLASRGVAPRSIVEPTCGTGGLLRAALDAFPGFERALGVELDPGHAAIARAAADARPDAPRVAIEAADFFTTAWPARLAALADPILVIGNPPWVTNADLGALASDNLPIKANADRAPGLAALTGKSNFDISEAMLRSLIVALAGRAATLAMLCKASVARKLLAFAWRTGVPLGSAVMARIDAAHHFGASVEACLLILELAAPATAATDAAPGALATIADAGTPASEPTAPTCRVLDSLAQLGSPGRHTPDPAGGTLTTLGYRGGRVVADAALYDHWQALEGDAPSRWRSGIKHDCAAVMELRRTATGFENRAGEQLDLGDARWLYPLWKSSEVARGRPSEPQRYLVVPQARVGDDTRALALAAPGLWRYLCRHRAALDRRASAIYRDKPPFAIFGVGDYSFAPWKIAISGLYKKLAFVVVGPHAGQPVVFDDTCYFLPCASEPEARLIVELLATEPARAFYASQVFWDAKRPITTELLRRLDLGRLAHLLGRGDELDQLRAITSATASPATPPSSAAGPASRSARTG